MIPYNSAPDLQPRFGPNVVALVNVQRIPRWIFHIIQNLFHNMQTILSQTIFFEKTSEKFLWSMKGKWWGRGLGAVYPFMENSTK